MAETIDGVPAAAGARPWESLDARAIPVVFRGDAREYYGIWIVNLLLTIVTLGIYSAWAKVRRVRYFRGNTFIGGDSFDYHAPPIAILKGRILLVIVLVGWNALTNFNPLFNLLWLVVLAGFPWLMNRSLRFNARYTSWRGVRFNFLGSYGGAFFAFIFMPFVAGISLYTLLPFWTRATQRYFIDNHRFGRSRFYSAIPIGSQYGAFLLALVFFAAAAAVIAGSSWVIATMFGNFEDSGSFVIGAIVLPLLVGYIPLLLAGSFYFARSRNIALANTTLRDGHTFVSRMSGLTLAWIMASNAVAINLSLGLATPWAAVRSYRYQAEAIAMVPASDLSEFINNEREAGSAVGAEFVDLEGIDISF